MDLRELIKETLEDHLNKSLIIKCLKFRRIIIFFQLFKESKEFKEFKDFGLTIC